MAKQQEGFTPAKPKSRRLLVTTYVVKQQIHQDLFKTIKSFAKQNDYEIIVIPINFVNPTTESGYQKALEDEWFSPEVVPYLCWKRLTIGGVTIRADVRINPSTQNPVATVKSLVCGNTVFAHTSQSMGCRANSVYVKPHQIWCTGHINVLETVKNVANKRAEFTARHGFLLIEDGLIRNVHATQDGAFIDLNSHWAGGVCQGKVDDSVAILGDIHIGQHDNDAIDWVMAKINELDCIKKLVLHDVFDGSTINPHSNPENQRAIFKDLATELRETNKWLEAFSQEYQVLLVESNHHNFIDRWFRERKGKELTEADKRVLARHIQGGHPALFPGVTHVKYDHKIFGVYVGRHGDKGQNGAKGSIGADYRAGQRSISGHSHEPGILGGAERVGCLTKIPMDYNRNQLSTSAHSFAVLNRLRKIQHFLR